MVVERLLVELKALEAFCREEEDDYSPKLYRQMIADRIAFIRGNLQTEK